MSFIEFLKNLFAKPAPLHSPRDGYKSLKAIKYLRQIVTADSRTSRTLMWGTDERLEDVRLEYKLLGDDAAAFGSVVVDYFEQGGEAAFIYTCAIQNLKPESLYNFRIIAGERAGDWQNLRTGGDGEFEMLVFSDSQCVDYGVWRRTAETAHRKFPDAEIFAVNGDLIDNGQAPKQWRAWFDAAEKLLADRIFAPVMGNHECYGLDWLDCLPTGFLHYFKVPSNGVRKFGGYFYSFDYGAAHFIVLNTQFMEIEKFNAGMEDAEKYWLRRDAANANRPWRIVLMHKDIYDYNQDKFSEIAEIFMALFDELAIDLVLTGHLHTYRNRGKIFEQRKSERGTQYVLCGRSGDQKYTSPKSELDDVRFENLRKEPPSFIALKVRADSLDLTAQTVDGELLDSFTLKR